MSVTSAAIMTVASTVTMSATSTTVVTISPGGRSLSIPLTTLFTAPPNCFGHTYRLGSSSNDSLVGYLAPFLFHGFTPSCYPSGAESVIFYDDEPYAYFSPGMCPYGFTTAQASFDGSVTNAYCCPTGWTIFPEGNAIFDCSFTGNPTVTIISGNQTNISTTGVAQLVRGFSVYSASGDIPSATTTISSTASSSSTVSSSSTSTSSPMSSYSNAQLSTGAKVGISVGAVTAAFTVMGVLGIFVQRRLHKNRSARLDRERETSKTADLGKAELPGQGKQRPEFGGDDVHEVVGMNEPQEMDIAANFRAELDGNWEGWEALSREV